MIQMQVFSSEMNENLINDLLDLAKLDYDKFVIHKDYFNLVKIVQNSFTIIHRSAKLRGINMKAVIDDQANLDLI